MKKSILCLLAAVFALVVISVSSVVPVSAAHSDKVDEEGNPLIDYTMKVYPTKESKLADMTLMKEENGYQIWVEEFTGEVAFVNAKTGEALFSNPYDLAGTFSNRSSGSISKSVKQKLLSQIVLTYETNGSTKTMLSFVEAALRNQIKIKNIKGGIRVEYTMGEQEVTRLVPRMISKERYETMILANLEAIEDEATRQFILNKFDGFFALKDKDDDSLSERSLKEMFAKFPITKTMAVYVCTPEIQAAELSKLEGWIKQYCPNYTYEDMAQDHEETGYTGTDAAPPLFRLALEYTIGKDGSLEVRLPANGIRYDETAYTLKDISILPYFGAGSNEDKGYALVPDGTGTLYRFEDLIDQTYNKAAQLYGDDYAYHLINENAVHTEIWRYPVFGVVSNINRDVKWTEIVTPGYTDEDGNVVEQVTENKSVHVAEDRGYVAIITEGDSLTTLFLENGGTLHPYTSVYAKFTPHPSDSYDLADSISVADNVTWTVMSESKFTGSYRIKYVMLEDKNAAKKAGTEQKYETSYIGMAKAYRDYLYESGQIEALEKTAGNTPLFIEAFGSIVTKERVLSFPVDVDKPLTKFEDVKTMYDELAAEGIDNIKFKLTGFANGGMRPTAPYKLAWVDALGGADGFTALLDYAREKGFGVYPEFDFAYVTGDEAFDGISYKNHLTKTIDGRFTTKKYYDPSLQSFVSNMMQAVVSPSVYNYLFEGFSKNYSKYSPMGISVSTLGSDLNSDFDEDDAYNREECKEFTKKMLEKLEGEYKDVMVDAGNAYSFSYADMIINISTDSSNYMISSESVPFLGIVLHGAKTCAGTAINMEGDVYTSILKSIENGYYLNFKLSYQNTDKMKDDVDYSNYYSVKYEYWKDDVIKYYNILNEATKDLQNKLIDDHDFLSARRVADADEIEADDAQLEATKMQVFEQLKAMAVKEERAKRLEARQDGTFDPATAGEIVVDEEALMKQAEQSKEYKSVASANKDRYNTKSGTVVLVEYEGGVKFILNYNSFDVTVNYGGKTYTIPALYFERIG